jgi:hypothetical protein
MKHERKMWDRRHRSGAAAALIAFSGSIAIAGPDWIEDKDAGSSLGGAQRPRGTGTLHSISGSLSGADAPDFEDCYIVRVANTATFSLQVSNANFNPQIFLFRIGAAGGASGLLANDDRAVGNPLPRLTVVSNDDTNVVVSIPGDYMIAVTGFNRDPVTLTGPVFDQNTTTQVSGPDGRGGFNELTGWTGNGQTGSYVLTFTGAEFPSRSCYPNCDGSTGTPILTPNDFQCFMSAYAAGCS